MPLSAITDRLSGRVTGTSRGMMLMLISSVTFIAMQSLTRHAGEQVQQREAEESAWEVMIGPGFGPGRDYALYMATV